jgi:hypothetical protein
VHFHRFSDGFQQRRNTLRTLSIGKNVHGQPNATRPPAYNFLA